MVSLCMLVDVLHLFVVILCVGFCLVVDQGIFVFILYPCCLFILLVVSRLCGPFVSLCGQFASLFSLFVLVCRHLELFVIVCCLVADLFSSMLSFCVSLVFFYPLLFFFVSF